jgi:hypothetical protein
MNQRRASIIPVEYISSSCHLIPRFGRRMNKAWVAETVLEVADQFYLNPYLRHQDFVSFYGLS